MNVLLIEPKYRNKYPPLGLMKLSAFHKERGDKVKFVKGLDKDLRGFLWDRIYITTLFSFFWKATIETVKYYEHSVEDPSNIFIGGPMATIMADEIRKETGFNVVSGLLNEKGKVNLEGDENIDCVVPDYSILDEIDYKYPAGDAYFTYATRGCVRKCKFCAVPQIEPDFIEFISFKNQIFKINELYGEKKDLLLMDNNALASNSFERIIEEVKDLGFVPGAKFENKQRYVDFNQGLDLRLLTDKNIELLSSIQIRPLRIAFDSIEFKDKYVAAIEKFAEKGVRNLSNYILYNYKDDPEELYQRLHLNVMLNERLGTKIFSFPMKFIPVDHKDRTYVGDKWSPRYLRAIQCVLNATRGIVSPKRQFFEAAFGESLEEFRKIVKMPEEYILNREKHKKNGAKDWAGQYAKLTSEEKVEFEDIIYEKNLELPDDLKLSSTLTDILAHYSK